MFELCYVTDRKQLKPGQTLEQVVSLAAGNGADAVMLREKDLKDTALLLRLAERIKKAAGKVEYIINGRCDIALAVNAGGVHLSSNSISVKQARKIMGRTKLIGKSCHSQKDALLAQKAGADYIFLGPVFYTKSKAKYGKPLGCGLVRKMFKTGKIKIPVIGVGGIIPNNTAEVIKAGAFGVAVISGISKAEDPGKAAALYREAIEKNRFLRFVKFLMFIKKNLKRGRGE